MAGGPLSQEASSVRKPSKSGLSRQEALSIRKPPWTRDPLSREDSLDRRLSQSGGLYGQETLSSRRPLDKRPSQSGQEALSK